MRRRAFTVVGVVGLLLSMAWPAAAQQPERTPSAMQLAIGGDVGIFVSRGGYDDSVDVDGFVEFYLHRRISPRAMAGFARPGVDRASICPGTSSLPTTCVGTTYQQVRLEGSVVYNFEAGEWHPFLFGGLGGTFFNNPLLDEFYTPRLHVQGGGGIEYFARPYLSVKGEFGFHAQRHHDFDPDPSGLTVSIGLKRYF
jgi:hypothetical protein